MPSHRWSYETLETVRTTIERYLAPVLIGMDACDANAIHAAMNRMIAPSFSTGQPIAKAGIDLAIFDLTGKVLHKPTERRGDGATHGQNPERERRAVAGPAAQRWGRKGRGRIFEAARPSAARPPCRSGSRRVQCFMVLAQWGGRCIMVGHASAA